MSILLKLEMDHLDLPSSTNTAFGLRPSKSVPSVLLKKPAQNQEIQNHAKLNSSADSLLLVVVDQVQSWFRITAGPPNNDINKSDLTFLLDSEGGGGFCFQALNEQEAK